MFLKSSFTVLSFLFSVQSLKTIALPRNQSHSGTANGKFSRRKTLIANSDLAQLNGRTLKSKSAKLHVR